ncbi:hypothetical protein H0264_18520 [Nocardia huaxiensis]|uniref:Uncharacterized protein n=1 Tax=Nocardia huaxiensis TaxID=2755382 RepID=A0A7D6VIS4_9NOCA|nr:hypothetical protein [Nocardia huaxiensis]QLY33955.1 hypothetical protein H0264_18520 [Nocardia huaxiensis]
MNWTALFGPKAVLEAENDRLRRTLAERDARISELSAALDDALDREQLHSLSAPHERLTPAAVLDRFGHHRAEHLPQPGASSERGTATQASARPWMTLLESTVAGVPVAQDRRRSR